MNVMFWVFFGVGAGYTVIGFILGEVFNVFDFDTDFGSGGTVSPLKPAVLAAFATVFGGAGLLLQFTSMPVYGTLPISALIGTATAYAMYRFVIVPLSKAQNTSSPEIQSLIGCAAKVTEKIFQGGYGQIAYAVNGNTFNSPAKSDDGVELARGTDVEIMYIEDNTYYVRKKF